MVSHNSGFNSENSRNDYVQRRQQKQYFRIRDLVYATATDPNIGLLFAHFPLPHPFAIYNRERRDFTLNNTLSYVDSLALVDRTVGELRQALEQAGLWQSTTVLITADHGFRPDMWRDRQGWTPELEQLTKGGQSPLVPFILKLPEEDRGLLYEQPFSNVVSGDLILAILEGQVRKASDAAQWLDQHAQEKRAARAGTFMR
jgi:arylsulfatase A-like enzyme